MKNFPSALIRQKNTKGGLGETLGSTLKNIGTKALSNIFNGGSANNIDLNSINNNFEEGYERLDVQHEIDSININNIYNKFNDSGSDNELNTKIHKNALESISLNWNESNGTYYSNWSNFVKFEDPFLYSSSLFDSINNYKYILNFKVPNIINHYENTSYSFSVIQSVVTSSLFNPYNGVNFNYITEGIPLLTEGTNLNNEQIASGLDLNGLNLENDDGLKEAELVTGMPSGMSSYIDITDCSIRNLVKLSNETGTSLKDIQSPLGLATYRYIDFMYCKDLGKISNNHLITLRKFGHPIGDNIFKEAIPLHDNNSLDKANYDIGRLITWFDNEDNKLEDICKYNYNASWKEFKAQIQQMPSTQQDGSSTELSEGLINKIANAFSPSNNKLVAGGYSQNYGLLQWGANKLHIPILSNKTPNNYYDWTTLSNYDQNRIYEPQDTIWDTHKYEGHLTFNQDITLVFRYTLRSYANINPKSAFLDLIGNIMAVTYRRGSFWGGESKIYGPQGNNSVYNTANAFIDKSFDKLGGVWKMLREGSLTPDVIKGWLGNIMQSLGDMMGTAVNAASGFIKDAAGEAKNSNEQAATDKTKELAKKGFDWLETNATAMGWTNAIKGMLKNQLGRPAIYAFNSLLSGEAVGPWHLTIGNPLNPIMSMGNMIMTNSEIQHLGPLGLDDFPTEIKVTVTLKHGRPRDSVEIQKMYTKGREAIYKPMNLVDINKYYTNPNAFGDVMQNLKYNKDVNFNNLNAEYNKKIAAIYKNAKNGQLTKEQHEQIAKITKEYSESVNSESTPRDISSLNKLLRTI